MLLWYIHVAEKIKHTKVLMQKFDVSFKQNNFRFITSLFRRTVSLNRS